jgi:hypothetical protein
MSEKIFKIKLIKIYFVFLILFWFLNFYLISTGQLVHNTVPIQNNKYDTRPNIGSDNYLLLDSLYFTVVSQTGTGYGDITPGTPFARFVITIHLLSSYIIVGCLII